MKTNTPTEDTKVGIIYCRVSSKEQVEGTSLETQEVQCEDYARKEGIKILKTFVEKGESAKTANRTEFKKALEFCGNKRNGVTHFIVYKLDRFTRSQEDHAILKGLFKKIGVKLLSVTEQFDESPMGRAIEGIAAIFAQLDNDNRSERCSRGMLERLKQGVWQWQAPLGYFRPTPGSNIVPEPNISPLVQLAFEEYAKGTYTYKKLSRFISERGLRSKSGKPITPQLMEKILKNPLYCGIIETWGPFEGSFEPIVSKDLFARCQSDKIQSAYSAPRSVNNPLFPLRKLVTCSECQKPLTGSTSKGRGDKYYSYYHHHSPSCGMSRSIPKETLEQLFAEYLDDISPDEKYEKLFKEIVLDTWKRNYQKSSEENAKINRAITKLEGERQKIFDFHRAGKYSDEDFQEQTRLMSSRIEQKRLLLSDNWREEIKMEEVLDYCFSYVRNSAEAWKKAEYEQKIRLQRLVFAGSVEFDGKKFGTADLSLIYKINQASQPDLSNLVDLIRNSWDQLILELKEWKSLEKAA